MHQLLCTGLIAPAEVLRPGAAVGDEQMTRSLGGVAGSGECRQDHQVSCASGGLQTAPATVSRRRTGHRLTYGLQGERSGRLYDSCSQIGFGALVASVTRLPARIVAKLSVRSVVAGQVAHPLSLSMSKAIGQLWNPRPNRDTTSGAGVSRS